jgi:uncharacterized protein YjiS (DUF1127 family)
VSSGLRSVDCCGDAALRSNFVAYQPTSQLGVSRSSKRYSRRRRMRESVRRWWRAVRSVLGLWQQRMRGRAELARMTEAELKDARINPYEAWLEVRKPF